MNVSDGTSEAIPTSGYCYGQVTSPAFFVLGERLSIDEDGLEVDCNSCGNGT